MNESFKSLFYLHLNPDTPVRSAGAYYRKQFPTIKRDWGWVKVVCPFHDDHHPSLSINLEHGGYRCFACGVSGDLIGFHMALHGMNFSQAQKDLEMNYGV